MSGVHRMVRGPYPTTLFRSGQFKGAWYDFSDPTTIYADASGAQITGGTGIYTLLDKSGNQNTLTQSTSGSRPAWNSGGYAEFDGSADYLFCTSNIGFENSGIAAPNWTMLALVSSASPSTGDYLFSIGSSASNNPAIAVGTGASTASTAAVFFRSDSGSGGQTNANALQTNTFVSTPTFIGVQKQGELSATVGVYHCFLNNVRTIFTGQSAAGTYTLNRFALGVLLRTTASAGSYLNMNLYQFLLINRCLSHDEINGVMSFWRGKTGL